jgi:hypothetical protein
MRTEEAEALEQRVMGRVARLLRSHVIPPFVFLAIGVAVAVGMIAHAGRVSDYDRCTDGVDGRAVTRELFTAIASAVRADGNDETADFLQDIVDRTRPPEDKDQVCGDPPEWWDT